MWWEPQTNTCPCKEFVCHFCKKKGHPAKVCRKREKSTPEQAHSVNDQQIVPQDFPEEYLMHHVRAGPTRPHHVYVKLNSSPVRMEIERPSQWLGRGSSKQSRGESSPWSFRRPQSGYEPTLEARFLCEVLFVCRWSTMARIRHCH